jgi:pimeloyl-ACP methyl ester carboxylesterase
VGHDIGGGVALSIAIRAPTRVSRLCLVDSVAFDEWPPRELKLARAMLPLTRHLPPTWLLSIMRSDLVRGYADTERGAHSIEQYLRPFAGTDGRDAFIAHLLGLDNAEMMAVTPRLKDIVSPTAVVWGEHDPFLPPSVGRRLCDSIPGATLEVLPDVRHFTPEEAPEKVAAVVSELLRR